MVSLMGAAAAVLLIPTLQWVETEQVAQQEFDNIVLAQNPLGAFSDSCNDTQLAAGSLSCTANTYGPSLDAGAATALASTKQFQQPNRLANVGTSQEAAVQFVLNASDDRAVIWVANRQVLRDVSLDYLAVIGEPHYYLRAVGVTEKRVADPRFRTSLQTILYRQGPAVGLQANCYAGNVSITHVADDREIHCFTQWSIGPESNFAKCIRVGLGFNDTNEQSHFWLGQSDPSTQERPTAVDSYFSGQATFFNETEGFGSGIVPCLNNQTAPSCDWDKMFSAEISADLKNSSVNSGVISYSIPYCTNSQARVWCDAMTYLGFPTYSLDTSVYSNELHLVQMDGFNTSKIRKPLVVSPDWFLAACSVDRNGTADGSRQITKELRKTLSGFWEDQSGLNAIQLFYYHTYPLGQAMSMVNYHTNPPKPGDRVNPDHPVFVNYAQLHVWAWGLSRRISKLGVAIAICGCVCVVARVLLGCLVPRKRYSLVELVVAALQYQPDGDFKGMGERDMARVRYAIQEEYVENRGSYPDRVVRLQQDEPLPRMSMKGTSSPIE